MMLVIRTQVYENYGDRDRPHWKAKGGSEYKVLGVPHNVDPDAVVAVADVVRNDDYFKVTVIDCTQEADDYLSDFEHSQIEWDGKIVFAEPTVEYTDLISQ